jgi:hypothetical protein
VVNVREDGRVLEWVDMVGGLWVVERVEGGLIPSDILCDWGSRLTGTLQPEA